MTFADYFLILQRRWRVWVSCVLVGVGLAMLYNLVAPVRYTAVATSFVTVASSGGGSSAFQESQFAVQRVKSYAELKSSPDVIEPVIEDLDLNLTPREVRSMIEVTSPPETVLLQVSVTDTDAERAKAIADEVSRQLGLVVEELETPRRKNNSTVKVTLTQPANVPASPSSPRVLLNLILGVVAGAALGFVAAIIRHTLDRRIKSEDDVRTITGMSPLGGTLHEKAAQERPLVSLDWRSAAAERYRTVRSALKFATVDRDLRHFVVTSPTAGDGKTTVACNLAISWSQSGAKVCLVEADLRRPGVSRVLGIEGNIGLSDVLVDDADLHDVLVPWNRESITVLPGGSLPPDPAALLGSEAMHALVTRLRSRFDIVIYDSAPLSVTDAAVLGQSVDGMVLVARWAVTSREQLAACVEALRLARLPLLGTVLSGVKVRGRAAQHAYYPAHLTEDRAELPLPNEMPKSETTAKSSAKSSAKS